LSRPVRIATTSFLLEGERTFEKNMQTALALVDQTLKEKPDIICLPEVFPVMGLSKEACIANAETVPGSVTRTFQEKAREGNCHIIVPLLEHDRTQLRNTAVLLGRKGEIIGRYHKTHLAPSETEFYGTTPGDEYPVFECDFGRVGIMICMDIHYPEVARILALKGADIIFWPTMAYGPTGQFLEVLLRSRAMDNQVYAATSNYIQLPYLAGKCMGRACIIGPDGNMRADTGHRPGVAVAAIDLDEGYDYWIEDRPEWRTLKHVFLGLRRPETYGPICEPWQGEADSIRQPADKADSSEEVQP